MGARQEYEKRVEKKQKEITELEGQLREARVLLQAYQEFLRHLPVDESGGAKAEATLRPGTDLYKAKELLEKAGHPLYITDLLVGIGKEVTKENRVSLSGNLSWYVRKGLFFTRTAPNTFGLIGMKEEKEDQDVEVMKEATEKVDEEASEDSLPLQ
jgi:ABC-type transport system substrate-binding protein